MSRRQRRRSQQKKEGLGLPDREELLTSERRKPSFFLSKKLLLSGLVSFLLLLAVVFVGIRSYLRSDGFREMLAEELGEALDGEAEVGPLDWQGLSIGAEDVDFISDSHGKTGDWTVEGLQTSLDLKGIWRGAWTLSEIEVESLEVNWPGEEMKLLELAKEEWKEQRADKNKEASSEPKKEKGFFESLLPDEVELKRLAIEDFSGRVGRGGKTVRWSGVSLEGEFQSSGDLLAEIENGDLEVPFDMLGNLALKKGRMLLGEDGFELLDSDWTGGSWEELSLQGAFGEERQKASMDVVGWPVRELVPEAWHSRVSGELNAGVDWDGEVKRWGGEVTFDEGGLQNIAALDRLAAYAMAPQLQQIRFEQASAAFEVEPGSFAINNLRLAATSALKIEGQFTVGEGGRLQGVLNLAVPPGLLSKLPGAEEKVFQRGADGLLWTPIRLSGTWKKPEEDLSERLFLAAGERLFEYLPETGQLALRYTQEALDGQTADLLELVGGDLWTTAEGTLKSRADFLRDDLVRRSGELGGEAVESIVDDLADEGIEKGFELLNGLFGKDSNKDEEE